MSVFPPAYSLVAPYSEALFLAVAVWAFVFARERNWRGAGLLALIAGVTRIQGVFLVPALLVEYWLTRRRLGVDAAWLLVGLGGPLLYLALNHVTFGDALHFLDVQQQTFFVRTVAPWISIPQVIGNAARFEPTENWVTVYLAPAVALGILAAVTLWTAFGRGRRASYFVYSALTLATFVVLSWPISVPRYLMGVFPIFIAAGRIAVRPWIGVALFTASTLLLGMFATLFLIGHWAF
jgi:Gpi18-like mannosyltransferase